MMRSIRCGWDIVNDSFSLCIDIPKYSSREPSFISLNPLFVSLSNMLSVSRLDLEMMMQSST